MPRKQAKTSNHGGARPGSGRPRLKDAGVTIAGRIAPPIAAKLDAWAERNGLTRSRAVAEAVRRLVG
jgi:hypothetical protein